MSASFFSKEQERWWNLPDEETYGILYFMEGGWRKGETGVSLVRCQAGLNEYKGRYDIKIVKYSRYLANDCTDPIIMYIIKYSSKE